MTILIIECLTTENHPILACPPQSESNQKNVVIVSMFGWMSKGTFIEFVKS